MYTASDGYMAYIGSNTVRKPKSKIEVGDFTYTGETALVSFPKITHSTDKIIGTFPAKTCSFEVYNLDGNVELNGKEVTVFRGQEINGAVEWVPMGIFSANDDNIKNNLTKHSISFRGTDRSSLFDVRFVSNNITYPCTVLAFVQSICERHEITLETTEFPFAERTLLSGPNADSSISERELIARIAELGGCIAQISRSGGLRISAPVTTDRIIAKRFYKTVSKEPKFGAIEAITLGHQNYTDDIVYPDDAGDSAVNWRIEDSPFVDGAIAESDGITPTTRSSLIADIACYIIGRELIPFSVTDFVDDYIYDVGDIVTVEAKDGSTFESVILNISTSSRIKTSVGAGVQTPGSTDYSLAGSTKEALNKVALEVDHQQQTIKALAQEFNELGEKVSSQLSVMAGKIEGVVTADDLSSTVTQLNNKWTAKFESVEDPESITNTATSISAEGVKIYNGKIEIYNADDDMIFGTDENGALTVTGNICVQFKNAAETDTATLKITNEDYADLTEDYATASIKVSNSVGGVFSTISMYEVGDIGTTSIKSDIIELSNEGGDVSFNISDSGISAAGDVTIFGDSEIYGSMYMSGILTTKADRFEGYRHVRNSSDVYGMLKPGVGVVTLTNSVDYATNNLATTPQNIDGTTYDTVILSEKKYIKLSKLRSTAGLKSVTIEFTGAKYGWARYYFAYTKTEDGELYVDGNNHLLLDLFNTSNHMRTRATVPIPDGAVQWCIVVYPDTASTSYYAGWYNVFMTENKPIPTAALELQGYNNSIICRLDCYASDGEAYVVLQGRKGSNSSARLELGKTNLYWGGSVACSSEESAKTNITSAASVLDKVRNAGIYSYNYISEGDESESETEMGDIITNGGTLETVATETHYGLVIGDGYNTPDEVISSDGKHVDLYSMVALAWKAIQELAEKIETEET